jgi:hypothetical protein
MSMTALIEQMPGTVSRAYKMLGDYQQEIRPRTAKEQVLADCDDVEWREWQQEITDLTKTQPDGRTIHWYLESTGISRAKATRVKPSSADTYKQQPPSLSSYRLSVHLMIIHQQLLTLSLSLSLSLCNGHPQI